MTSEPVLGATLLAAIFTCGGNRLGTWCALSLAALLLPATAQAIVIVATNVEPNENVFLRITGKPLKQITLLPRKQRPLNRRPLNIPSGQKLELYVSADVKWQPIRMPTQNKDIELQILRQPGKSPKWSVRRFERPVVSNSIAMKLIPISAGKFRMGSRRNRAEIAQQFSGSRYTEDPDDFSDEYPSHAVEISRPFYISAFEVTHGQFADFVEDSKYQTDAETNPAGGGAAYPNSGYASDDEAGLNWRTAAQNSIAHSRRKDQSLNSRDLPVVHVSWNDAVKFCKWLSEREGYSYRLPTEAEWEYAARGGTKGMFNTGDDVRQLKHRANVPDAARRICFGPTDYPSLQSNDGYCGPAPVGSYQPNAFGIFDMHGNVWEWCSDHYSPTYYRNSPVADPICGTNSLFRVVRGGCFL